MKNWIHDYETLSNCFVAIFKDYKSEDTRIFVIHESKNDIIDLYKFLDNNIKNNEWHISYNGLAFDSQITHYLLDNRKFIKENPNVVSNLIYKYASKCIQLSDNKSFQDYNRFKIKQIDLFKMHHWDNPAKRSSLKWIQYSMDWENLLEMPIDHRKSISSEEINTIIEYCLNDVNSTKEIYNRSIPLIKLRMELSKKYQINLYSASEPKISKELFAYYLSKQLNIPITDIKKLRTNRDKIVLKDIILPFEFKSPEFINLLEKFKNVILDANNLKGSFKYSLNFNNVVTDFGLGGVHGATKPGIYKSDEEYIIVSSDVVSFYPNLVIKNKWSPAHFPNEIFCNQYEWFFEERKKIPKKDPMNYVYKIILNSTFGLSNAKDSFFYDPELCMKITVNGQLSLMLLYEMIMLEIPNAKALMQNTDGIETKIPIKYLDKYMEICKKWESITNLSLEHDTYEKLILADVNNYIAINTFKEIDYETYLYYKKEYPFYIYKEDTKYYYAPVKLKGRFDFHNLALHKNKSKLIVAKAVFYYFVHKILPVEYLNSNKNIIDYCIGAKSQGDWKQVARFIDKNNIVNKDLQKINRYYICKSNHKEAVKIIKINKQDKREIQLESGKWMQCIFNKIENKNWEDYNVNISYYMQLIESEIENIFSKSRQLNLFE